MATSRELIDSILSGVAKIIDQPNEVLEKFNADLKELDELVDNLTDAMDEE